MNKIMRSVKSASHLQIGLAGEQYVATLLDTTRLHLKGHDVKYKTLRVEVKTARMNKRGNWQVMLRKSDKHGYTNCKNSDFLVIICLDSVGMINKLLCIKTNAHCLDGKQTMTIGTVSYYDRYVIEPDYLKAYLSKFV